MSAHTMRALRAACTLGLIALDCKAISKTAAPGNWVEANGVATAFSSTQSGSAPSGATAQVRLSFSHPVTADMVHASMNGAGALGLKLAQKQAVQALRFSFNPGPGQVELNHAALLRR